MKPAIEDLPNRRPVWGALSEMFLDNELESADIQCLGQFLADSPYTLEELEEILYSEVYPFCIWNLRTVAGEWAGFDIDCLQALILKREHSWLRIPRFLQMGHWMIRKPWRDVKQVLQELRRRAHESDGC
jgi:hypothetical protein